MALCFTLKRESYLRSLKIHPIKGTEISTIKVRLGKRNWALITNIYCPRNRTHNPVSLSLKHVVPCTRSLVTGDFNAHSGLCTSTKQRIPEERISIENQITILNDGSHTRRNRSVTKESSKARGLSSPDVLLCGTAW